MKRIKIFAAILAAAFVMASSFTTVDPDIRTFGFQGKTLVNGSVYDYTVVDLAHPNVVDPGCEFAPTDVCLIELDYSQATNKSQSAEIITFRMDQTQVEELSQGDFVY
jgi:type 1 fimbria pilin